MSHYVFTEHKRNTFNGLDCILCWLLLFEEYREASEYLPRKKNVVVDTVSCLDIDCLKFQELEILTILPESESNSTTSNIQIQMHTALIFKVQAKVKELGLREKA
jgi:hypothetical protein